MTSTRGQPPRSIYREYPYQVVVPAESVQGKKLAAVLIFFTQVDVPRHSRSLFKDDRWYEVFCFADLLHARSFQAIFGGKMKEAIN